MTKTKTTRRPQVRQESKERRRRFSSAKPLTVEITANMRESMNREWYWDNRDTIVSDPNYYKKVVLIDDGKVVAVFDSVTRARMFKDAEKPECFLTIPGAEDYYKQVLVSRRKPSETLILRDYDVLPGNFQEPVELAQFIAQTRFYGRNDRPYVLLPVRTHKLKNNLILPTWFLVDTGSPSTFVTKATATKIFGVEPDEPFRLNIAGNIKRVNFSEPDFEKANLLGTDFIYNRKLFMDFKGQVIRAAKTG